MPIVIKDFEWNQTENTLIIKVPLRGVHSSKAEILCSKFYLKASYEQYYFEVFLLYEIDTKRSSCTFTTQHIVFELVKCDVKLWDELEVNVPKPEKQRLKQMYIEEHHKEIQEESERMKTKKHALKKLAVVEQLSVDKKQRKMIGGIKEAEKTNALKEMEIWRDDNEKKVKPKNKTHNPKASNSSLKKLTENKKPTLPVPAPRTTQTLDVLFTPREFPTPCRESKLPEEEEWLQKQAEARRSVGFISEDLRPEEHSPQFLKGKGDEFLRSGNFLGALSAYTFGIKLNNNFVDLFVARSEAHLAVGNYNKAINDCTRALELLKPEVPQNLRERALCIGRRGIALAQLGLLKQGIEEIRASLRLQPNEGFSRKLDEAIEALNSNAPDE